MATGQTILMVLRELGRNRLHPRISHHFSSFGDDTFQFEWRWFRVPGVFGSDKGILENLLSCSCILICLGSSSICFIYEHLVCHLASDNSSINSVRISVEDSRSLCIDRVLDDVLGPLRLTLVLFNVLTSQRISNASISTSTRNSDAEKNPDSSHRTRRHLAAEALGGKMSAPWLISYI